MSGVKRDWGALVRLTPSPGQSIPDANQYATNITELRQNEMTFTTSQKIADALAAEPCAPEFDAQRQTMVKLALQDHYHDYFGTAPCPITDLHDDCLSIGMTALAARVRNGEFDATKEESDARAASPEGQALAEKLSPEMQEAVGLKVHPQANTLGDGPIEQEYRDMMTSVVGLLDRLFNGNAKGKARQTGFVLLVFPFGEKEGRCNYISNGANREDMKVLLREQLARFEGQPDVTGRA